MIALDVDRPCDIHVLEFLLILLVHSFEVRARRFLECKVSQGDSILEDGTSLFCVTGNIRQVLIVRSIIDEVTPTIP
jgi:hypothetical protein